MKILLFRQTNLPELSPGALENTGMGATETSVIYLAEELSKYGHKVKVCTHVPRGRWYGNVEYIPFLSFGEASIATAMFSPDILIVAGDPSILFDNPFLSARKIMFWQQNHPDEMTRFPLHNLPPAITVIAPSPEAARYYESCYHKDIVGIYNGVRPEFFETNEKRIDNRVVYTGSFTRAKGLSEVLIAARNLPEYDFHLCGSFNMYGFSDDPYKAYCMELAEGLNNLTFKGSLTGKETASEMAQAQICIANPFPQNKETCCVSALEAMATGTPVIAGGDTVVDPIIHRGGITCTKDLAGNIKSLMDDPDRRKQMGRLGRTFAESVAWENIGKEWHEFLSD